MNYPLISEYIEAIKSAEDNFEELSYLRPVLGADGLPVMTGGNFAEVFKMKDVKTGKFYAVKCFTKVLEIDTYNGDACRYLAIIFAITGRLKQVVDINYKLMEICASFEEWVSTKNMR